jgi:hypothetical protein
MEEKKSTEIEYDKWRKLIKNDTDIESTISIISHDS